MAEFSWTEVGEILGTRVTLLGEDSPGPEKLVLPSGVTVVTDNALPYLVHSCRAFDLEHLVCLIGSISAVQMARETERRRAPTWRDRPLEPLLRDYQLALVLKVALADSERTGSAGTQATGLALTRLCKLVVSSRSQADEGDLQPAEFFTRMAYQQFWDQVSFNVWPRGLLILRGMMDLMAEEDRYDIETAFAAIHGLGFTTFVFLCFALFSTATKQGGRRFDVRQFTSSPAFAIEEQDAEAFLDLISVSLDGYRECANAPEVCEPGYEMYNFNPLVRWPALRHTKGGVVVPIPRLLLDRATTGIYYDFFKELEPEAAGKFGNFWGKSFETYVGHMLRQTAGLPEPMKGEDVVGDGSACDWVLHCGDRWVLIECKTRGLSLRSRTTGRKEAIEEDILGRPGGASLPKGIAQLVETEAALRRAGVIRSGAECVLVLVTFDQLYFANEDRFPVHALLRLGAESLTSLPIPYFHVASVSEMEDVCRVVETMGCDLGEALSIKARSADARRRDLGLYMNQTYRPPAKPISLHSEFLRRGMEEILTQFRRDA
jgi:hypothetical protein